MSNLARGIGAAATHPVSFAKAAVNWDTWARNPGRALGKTVPDALMAAGSAGAGVAAKGLRSGKALERTADAADDAPPASSALAGRDLAISLAKESQMAEKGAAIAGSGTKPPFAGCSPPCR